jgi:2-C-methyl-D-erythritol 4-phosphate cytidylyltransferase
MKKADLTDKQQSPLAAAIVVAAGRGTRMGGDIPKQFEELSRNPLLSYSLSTLQSCDEIGTVILVITPEWQEKARELVKKHQFTKVLSVIPGGERRQDSVQNGLNALPCGTDYVVIHDGARPFATKKQFRETLETARETGAAITAIPPTDTIKEGSLEKGVTGTIDRNRLWAVQTPQAFEVNLLKTAYNKAEEDGLEVTDDAQIVEHYGKPVGIVMGSRENIKVTHPIDWDIARAILKSRE